MKKILGLVLYAAVMFGVTAGLGMFMMKKNASHGGEQIGEGETHAESGNSDSHHTQSHDGAAGSASSAMQTDDASAGHSDSHSNDSETGTADDHQSDEQLPVAVRASPMSIEEIVRMGLSLKARDETLRKREAFLKDAESQQGLIQSDIEGAQQVVENLLAQANDQRAAIEELVARMNTQQEAVSSERQAIAADQQQLKADREKLDADHRQLEAQKTALAQNETDLQLKRRELDTERQQFDSDRSKITTDGDKLVKDRAKWVEEVGRMNLEKQQLAAEKEQIRVERETLEQDKQLLASTPGAAALPAPKKPVDAVTAKQNLKELTEMLEGLDPEKAASTIEVLCADGEIDMVVDVLVQLEQRKASAILGAIDDDKLVSEFLVRINGRKSQPKAAKN